ncbi:MAG: SEC-C domain-containing protein [Elusimicrobia bacterium]|nr:SEC-C domain-containing protein [Elusimicrobiota bacterium]
MAKLGSDKRPVRARVQSMERAQEIAKICESHGWKFVVGIEPYQVEDIADLERLLNPPAPTSAAPTPGRNEPCPCGSGKKYKKCCGQ